MVLGLFGGGSNQERDLRISLSLHKFEMEFPKMLTHFKIEAANKAGKSERYNQIESASRFMLTHALKQAQKKGKLNNGKDLMAAAVFATALCEFMGANGGAGVAPREDDDGARVLF